MRLWHSICSWLTGSHSQNIDSSFNNACDNGHTVNPATGLPMVNGCSGVDVGGNPFGVDNHHDHTWVSSSSADFSDSSSSWGDSCGSSWND